MGSDRLRRLRPTLPGQFQFTLPHGERQARWLSEVANALFQFTLPHGERQSARAVAMRRSAFQFTLPHGERPVSGFVWCATAEFQFTLPHGERHGRTSSYYNLRTFQFTLPHGERRARRRPGLAGCRFNSRSRMGSDHRRRPLLQRDQVSIHAPAWGATREEGAVSVSLLFQFTLPHGERLASRSWRGIFWPGFNSRSRMGSDGGEWLPAPAADVSIHAPAWGATWRPRRRRTPRRGFNSRSRMGSDTTRTASVHTTRRFNSRSRMGSDMAGSGVLTGSRVSIHAPAWGATLPQAPPPVQRHVSIHAPAWGATWRSVAAVSRWSFQFTLPHGERQDELAKAQERLTGFNSRSRMGSDVPPRPVVHRRLVSIHAPAWGATTPRLPEPLGLVVSIHAPAWGATCVLACSSMKRAVSIHAPAWGATCKRALDEPL